MGGLTHVLGQPFMASREKENLNGGNHLIPPPFQINSHAPLFFYNVILCMFYKFNYGVEGASKLECRQCGRYHFEVLSRNFKI